MSIRAMNWAMDQRTDGPSAQAVLYVIADRANEHGVCRHADPETIADKTRQSRATVFRRLEEMERAGVLARFTRHLEDGRREYEIRCRLDAAINYRVRKDRALEIYAYDDELCETVISEIPYDSAGTSEVVESQIETHGHESQIETQPVSPVRLPESHSCDSQESPSKSPKKDSPLPPKGGVTADDQGIEEARKSQTFAAFEAAGGEPILHQVRTRQIWAALTVPEEILATAAWRGYQANRRAQRKPPNSVNAHKFLQERDAWEGFAKLDAKAQTAAARVERTIRDPEGSAWIGLHVIVGIFPFGFNRDPGGKFLVPSPLPPAVVAFADLTDERGRADKTGWYFAATGTNQFGAWLGFVSEASGRAPRIEDFNGTPGLWVPWQWPPRKDGTLSTAGPDPLPDGIEDFR